MHKNRLVFTLEIHINLRMGQQDGDNFSVPLFDRSHKDGFVVVAKVDVDTRVLVKEYLETFDLSLVASNPEKEFNGRHVEKEEKEKMVEKKKIKKENLSNFICQRDKLKLTTGKGNDILQ